MTNRLVVSVVGGGPSAAVRTSAAAFRASLLLLVAVVLAFPKIVSPVSAATAEDEENGPAAGPLKVFVLAGQSNMGEQGSVLHLKRMISRGDKDGKKDCTTTTTTSSIIDSQSSAATSSLSITRSSSNNERYRE